MSSARLATTQSSSGCCRSRGTRTGRSGSASSPHLGSAVLHQDLPCHEWWHAALRPYEHYVPLARDLSDLRATLRALRRHDGAAARMGARLQRLAPKILGQAAVVAHVRRLLEGLAALQTYTPRLHPDAVPLGV